MERIGSLQSGLGSSAALANLAQVNSLDRD